MAQTVKQLSLKVKQLTDKKDKLKKDLATVNDTLKKAKEDLTAAKTTAKAKA